MAYILEVDKGNHDRAFKISRWLYIYTDTGRGTAVITRKNTMIYRLLVYTFYSLSLFQFWFYVCTMIQYRYIIRYTFSSISVIGNSNFHCSLDLTNVSIMSIVSNFFSPYTASTYRHLRMVKKFDRLIRFLFFPNKRNKGKIN